MELLMKSCNEFRIGHMQCVGCDVSHISVHDLVSVVGPPATWAVGHGMGQHGPPCLGKEADTVFAPTVYATQYMDI